MIENLKLYHPNGQYYGTDCPSTKNINTHVSWLYKGNEIHYKGRVYNYKSAREFKATIENEERQKK